MKLTMKHYYSFGKLNNTLGDSLTNNPDGWDAIRLSGEESVRAFVIPAERKAWLEKCETKKDLKLSADAILDLVGSGCRRIDSVGVGDACLEYFIKQKDPGIYLSCSDFTAGALDRLRKIFPEVDEIRRFNVLEDGWVDHGPGSVYMFYRMDSVFNDQEWQRIFKNMSQAGIQNILIVTTRFLTVRRFITQQVKYFLCGLLHKKLVFTSYVRTEEKVKELFGQFYTIKRSAPIGELKGFLLSRKDKYNGN